MIHINSTKINFIHGKIGSKKEKTSTKKAIQRYKKQLFKHYILNYVIYPAFHWMPFKVCKRMKKREKPLFYSNIPIAVKNYMLLTHSLIERTERFHYGSVIYIKELGVTNYNIPKTNEAQIAPFTILEKTNKNHIYICTQTYIGGNY